jgi:AcrR family transcriptional regulator
MPTRTGSDSRQAILAAAKVRFAEQGYTAATIRAIAADASIDPAMVIRYFGSKANLFALVADVDLRVPDLQLVPRAELGRALVGHFLDRWEGSDDVLLLLLRSATVEPAAVDRMRAIFAGQLVPAIATVLAEPREAKRRAGLIATQMLGLALVRSVLRLDPVVGLDRDTIVDHIGETVQRYLDRPL